MGHRWISFAFKNVFWKNGLEMNNISIAYGNIFRDLRNFPISFTIFNENSIIHNTPSTKQTKT